MKLGDTRSLWRYDGASGPAARLAAGGRRAAVKSKSIVQNRRLARHSEQKLRTHMLLRLQYNAVRRPAEYSYAGRPCNSSIRYPAYRTVPLPAELRVTLEKSPSKVRAAKISKTTPCKVAGGRRRSNSNLTRRANQRHSFIIPQSCKHPSSRNSGRVGCDCGRKSSPTIDIAPARRSERLPARGRTARASGARAREHRHEYRSGPRYANGDRRNRLLKS